MKEKIIIVTGGESSAKSSYLTKLAEKMFIEGNIPGGIISKRIIKEGKTSGYYAVDVTTSERKLLCTIANSNNGTGANQYYYKEDTIKYGNLKIIMSSETRNCTFIDEIRENELNGEGWAYGLNHALKAVVKSVDKHLLLSVNREILDDFIALYNICNYHLEDLD